MNQRIRSYTRNRPADAIDDDSIGCLALLYRDREISGAALIAEGGIRLLNRVARHHLATRDVRQMIATFYNGGPVDRLNRISLQSIVDLYRSGEATACDIESVGGTPLVEAVAAEVAAFA